jgi:two-component system, NtrC family, sensor kinase
MNRKVNNTQINLRDDFDREYALNELLPVSMVDGLCDEIQNLVPISIAVLGQDGTLMYAKDSLASEASGLIGRIKNQESMDLPKTYKTRLGNITIFSIIHQMETLGYLLVCHENKENRLSVPAVPLGRFLLKTFSHLITYKHQYKMTADLHEKIVEDSYEQLKEKAFLLEKSEQQYRQLAESLEIEVQKKTQEIKAAHAQLMQQEKMASIGHLAAGVAHEINNPMGFISSNLNTLNDYEVEIRSLIEQYGSFLSSVKDVLVTGNHQPDTLKRLEHITKFETDIDIGFILQDITNLIKESLEGAERIKRIIIDLKGFAHPGEDDLEFSDINKNFDSTLNVVWNELKYKANITKDYGDLPLVKCYPQQINQVFMNILVNAAQAIDEMGEIRITTRSEGEQVRITISDNGSGMPEENLSKIFDPFFTTKEVGKGTGLGLNIAYNLIKKHHGTIDVESTLGKGTTFSIRIPVNGNSQPDSFTRGNE